MTPFVPVLEVERLLEGQGRTVEIAGRRLAVWRWQESVYAVDDECPHRGASLGEGCLENGQLMCPLHGWSFDLVTGQGISNPHKSLLIYPTRIHEGWIEIQFPEPPSNQHKRDCYDC